MDTANDTEGFQKEGIAVHYPKLLDRARRTYERVRERIFSCPVLSLLKCPAMYVWALVLLVFYLIKERAWGGLALTTPLALSVLVCFLGPINGAYFRYFYGVTLCLPIVFVYCLYMCKCPKESAGCHG